MAHPPTHTTYSYAHAGPDAESIFGYVPNGYHPVNIDDIFNNRYRVVKKLGFGSHSTVWLVEDLPLGHFASLKVMTANASTSELSVSRYLQSQQEQNISHPGREHVIQILDTFIVEGPNGSHHCIVTEILGIGLDYDVEIFYGYEKTHFLEDITKRVAAQVALGVTYLHGLGVVHGDLHLANVLFYSPKLQTASPEELDGIYGPPEPIPILYKDRTLAPPSPHLPRHLEGVPERLPLLDLCLTSVDDIHVKICDFGEATLINSSSVEKPFETHMPRVLAAPEILFHDISSHTTSSMDVWALGVLLYMIINTKALPFHSDYGKDDEVIESMLYYLGKPPNRFWANLSERLESFMDGGMHVLEALKNHSKSDGIRGISQWRTFSDASRISSYV